MVPSKPSMVPSMALNRPVRHGEPDRVMLKAVLVLMLVSVPVDMVAHKLVTNLRVMDNRPLNMVPTTVTRLVNRLRVTAIRPVNRVSNTANKLNNMVNRPVSRLNITVSKPDSMAPKLDKPHTVVFKPAFTVPLASDNKLVITVNKLVNMALRLVLSYTEQARMPLMGLTMPLPALSADSPLDSAVV